MITTWSEGLADDNMAEEILVDLAATVRRHPWWIARADLTLALLRRQGIKPPARILDAGCGWGVTLDRLERRGYRVAGLDISRQALERLDRDDRELIIADLARDLPDDLEPFESVLALDVIEHIDDDRGAIRRLGQLLRPNGLLIVSVPALPEFFTEFDQVQGHRRRYIPETLRAAFDGSGLDRLSIFWWGQWLVPILKRQRDRPRGRTDATSAQIYQRYLTLPPWPLPHILRLGFALEQKKSLDGRLRTGTSLFATARRRAKDH